MTTVHLKFPDEATFAAAMPAGWERRGESAHPLPDGVQALRILPHPLMVGGRYSLQGVELEPPTLLPGYHVNALGDVPDAWRPYIVTPRSPLAVFGGGNV